MPDQLRLVAINGMLGYGYNLASLKNGIAAHLIPSALMPVLPTLVRITSVMAVL